MIVHWKTGLILDIQTSKESVHDFKLYKDTCPDWLPCDTKLLADSGYQGIAKLHEQSFTPFKKAGGGQLLALCKQVNHYLAKFGICSSFAGVFEAFCKQLPHIQRGFYTYY